jgi:hypothetical protein
MIAYRCKRCGNELPADMTKECPTCHPPVAAADKIAMTGTEIGTSTSQKIGFFGTTPVNLNGGALTAGSATIVDGGMAVRQIRKWFAARALNPATHSTKA